jgi:hypothetical protein
MKRFLLRNLSISLLFLAFGQYLHAQCTTGWNAATINWEQMDYLTRNGTYNAFVTNQMRDTQYFAIGVNRVKIQLNAITTNGENTTNTAEAGSFGNGADVEYGGSGAIVMTFDTVVRNLQFSLYDIDASQRMTITARDAANNPINIGMTVLAGGIVTVTGNNTTSAAAQANATGALDNDTRATVNISIAGSVAQGIKSVTITSSGTAGNFWMSDLTACVFGAFPLNYYASQKPFTGQPAYYLVTPDNNSVYLFNPLTGVSDWLFSEPSSPWVNSMAYDHVNHIIYYVRDNPSPVGSNKMLKKYDVNTESIGIVINDLTAFGIPLYDIVVESAGAAFYNGSLYLGVEGTNNAKNSNRESVIWRIDFDAAQNPVSFCQVWARPADNGGGTLTHDWGDFTIKDGMLYDFNTGNVGSTSQFIHHNLQNGNATFFNTNGNPAPIQAGQTWDGKLYWTGGQGSETGRVALYNENGTIGAKVVATVTACSPSWVGRAGDASDPFKPKSDFGDAPASYDPTGVDPATHEFNCNLRLGPTFDKEWNKTSSAGATADGTDEDGIAAVTLLAPGVITFVQNVRVYNNTGSVARLVAWLDVNANGVFEPGEGLSRNINSSTALQNIVLSWAGINITLPSGGHTYLRVRVSTNSALTVNTPNGWFANGEVEDYIVWVDQILPIKLLGFKAKNENDARVLLDWTTENETGFKGFEIERSADGADWSKLAFVPGNGGSSVNEYSYYDNNPVQGTNYYRLKMVDFDGNEKYSAVQTVEINQIITGLRVLPNPIRTQAKIQFNAIGNEKAEIRLLNAEGRLMQSQAVICNAGLNQAILTIPGNYAAGVYIVRVTTALGQQQAKVLVQRD